VLVEREQRAERVGIERRQDERRAGAVAGTGLVRLRRLEAFHQCLGLRASVREQDLVVRDVPAHALRDHDEVA
jgi:hypothetical protein